MSEEHKPTITGEELDRNFVLFKEVVAGKRSPSELKAALPDTWDGKVNWLMFVVQAMIADFYNHAPPRQLSEEEK